MSGFLSREDIEDASCYAALFLSEVKKDSQLSSLFKKAVGGRIMGSSILYADYAVREMQTCDPSVTNKLKSVFRAVAGQRCGECRSVYQALGADHLSFIVPFSWDNLK